MVSYLGDFAEDVTVRFMFNTFTSDDPSASSTITDFLNTDVHIHKDNGLTQRNNAAGITVSTNFDGITGSHMIEIDTNDDTVAGFWVIAKDYFVRIEGTTIDGAVINAVVGHFSIENRYNAVTDYDGPTKAEMDTAHALLATIAICTETRLAELDSGNLPTDIAAIPTTMVGTNNAALASVCTEGRLGELDAANLPTDIAAIPTTMIGTNNAALASALTTHDGKLDTVDTVVDGIQTDLDNATDGLGALKALIDAVDVVVDTILVDTNELQTDWVNDGRLDLLIDAIKAKTDNQPAGVPKNVALSNFMFLMMDSTDHITPKPGLTVVEEISKDGAAFATCTNTFAEVADGMYKIDLTQTEMNADMITLKFTAAGADDRLITIITSA